MQTESFHKLALKKQRRKNGRFYGHSWHNGTAGHVEKIIGKLDDDGLTQEEKDFFMTEANKPMNTTGVIASANGQPDMAAQIYAASLLAIEVDTQAEQTYMQQLASGLDLHPQVVSHIERTLGVQA